MIPYSSLPFFVPQLTRARRDFALGALLPLQATSDYQGRANSHEAMKLRASGMAKQWLARVFSHQAPGWALLIKAKSRKSTS